MATVVLLRHGRTTANAAGVLAGRAARVSLDEAGRAQARIAGERLAGVRLVAAVTSPLGRCRETARTALAAQAAAGRPGRHPPDLDVERGLTECDYGEWQGRSLRELARDPLWKTVQSRPSAVAFPGGEAMAAMQARAVDAVRRRDARISATHSGRAVWLAVSHGDVIKAILADALGLHLDLFQRLHVDPGSLSIVQYGAGQPRVLGLNTLAGDLGWLAPKRGRAHTGPGAPVGGGAGPTPDVARRAPRVENRS